MEEERKIVFDPLRHRTILDRIVIEFGLICLLRGADNEYVSRCDPIFKRVYAGEPVTMIELEDLLSEMHHQFLRPLKQKLAQLDNL